MTDNAPPKKDPRGLIKADIDHLRKMFRQQRFTPKHSFGQIMHVEGQQSVIDYIESTMIAHRGEY